MKILRWLFFLPLAIMGSALISGGINYIVHLMIPGWKIMKIISFATWALSGFLATSLWMAIGYKVAPKSNYFVKWILLLPLLLVMVGGLLGTILVGDGAVYNIPVSSVNGKLGQITLLSTGLLFALFFVFSPPPEEESKI